MTSFLVLDAEEVEIITFGLNESLRLHRKEMAAIMQIRLQKAADGEEYPAGWKETRFNALILRVSRLQKALRKIEDTPNADDPPEPG